MKFENKVAVITGAGGVLCSVFAEALADNGASVVLLDLHEESAKIVAERIIKKGGKALYYACNVLDKKGIDAVHDDILSKLGKCDILINGAGGNNPRATTTKEYYEMGDEQREDIKTFFNIDKEDFEAVFSLNLTGSLLPTQVFSQDMLEKGGVIINISSMNAFTPLTKIPAYSGAKSAVSNLTQWLAVHFAQNGIRVNAIAPGLVDTKMGALMDEKVQKQIVYSCAMQRLATPEEIANTALYLASDKASFINGQIIRVDGGIA